MKNDLLKLIRWFCRHLTFNDLASVVPVLQEVLTGSRLMELKPDEDRPPHYRQFRVDSTLPLTQAPEHRSDVPDWQVLQQRHQEQHGKPIPIVRHRGGRAAPEKCRCQHCNAPARYLYLNNRKLGSQILCKICKRTTPTHQARRESKSRYWCPHCGKAMFRWKEDGIATAYKCPTDHCPFYLRNLASLTAEERQMRADGNTSQFKLRYLFREYHFASEDLAVARPENAPVDLNRIHNNLHTVGLCLTFAVSFGLSARMTAQALKRVFDIPISHQTVINYNLSNSRETEPALSLLTSCYGPPHSPKCPTAELVTDGLPSYDSAVVAYNTAVREHSDQDVLTKRTVIGLRNLDQESEEYRPFKQLVERLNRTYKFHTRPRAGFKNFDGVVALTTLFVAFYNFMRPHGRFKANPPAPLTCLQGETLYPKMWVELLRQAA